MVSTVSTSIRKAEILEGTVSIVVNVILWAVRLVAGILSGSASLIVDAWHGLSDTSTSVVVIVSSKIASKPPDEDHPYGHGKVTDLASLFMGLMLVFIGLYFAIESIVAVSSKEVFMRYDMIIYAILTAVVVVPSKAILAYWAKKLGRKYGSTLCIADGSHHMADAFITAFVIVSLGLTYILRNPFVDRIVAIAIAVIVVYEGLKILRDAIRNLTDFVPRDLVESIKEIVSSIKEISDVHDIRVRNYGGVLFVEFCLHFKEKDIPLVEAHEISHRIEEMIKKRIKNVAEVLIHQEPDETAT
ncbi:MAG: cation transporter [Euryarchaeota archaeon]|nr:cation transporter [Euryarchaeota archaeon]